MHNQSQKQSNFLRICYIENMIITCPQDGKNFEVDDSLIPKKGRLVQCGFVVTNGILISNKALKR